MIEVEMLMSTARAAVDAKNKGAKKIATAAFLEKREKKSCTANMLVSRLGLNQLGCNSYLQVDFKLDTRRRKVRSKF